MKFNASQIKAVFPRRLTVVSLFVVTIIWPNNSLVTRTSVSQSQGVLLGLSQGSGVDIPLDTDGTELSSVCSAPIHRSSLRWLHSMTDSLPAATIHDTELNCVRYDHLFHEILHHGIAPSYQNIQQLKWKFYQRQRWPKNLANWLWFIQLQFPNLIVLRLDITHSFHRICCQVSPEFSLPSCFSTFKCW